MPHGATMVLAERARNGAWEHATWRWHARQPPFEEYLAQLRSCGWKLARYADPVDPEDNGLHGYTCQHLGGLGAVWHYHEELSGARRRGRGEPRVWFVSVVWRPAGSTPLPRPARLEHRREPPEPEPVGAAEVVRPALGTDDHGFAFDRRVRDLLGPLVDPGSLAGCEAAVALEHVKHALDAFAGEVPGKLSGDDWFNPLQQLRRHRAGMPLDDLLKQLADVFGSENPQPFLDEVERAGRLIWVAGPAGGAAQIVRLTERGHRAVDEILRRRARHEAVLLDGVAAEQLAVVRHACLQRVVNAHNRYRPTSENASGGPVADAAAPAADRHPGA